MARPSVEDDALSKIEVLRFSVVKVQEGLAPTPGEWKSESVWKRWHAYVVFLLDLEVSHADAWESSLERR